MNKKFKLTDKVTIVSIRSPEFKRWLMRTLAVVCIISLIFQFSTCVSQGLNAYAADEYIDSSAIGTWIFNNSLTTGIGTSLQNQTFNIEFTSNNLFFNRINIRASGIGDNSDNWLVYYPEVSSTNGYVRAYNYGNGYWYSEYKIIVITGGSDINNVLLLNWLNTNAVKQAPPVVHDFTNEIRVFNDELTFFITDQASWVDVFYFDYEILGLGQCDYLSLQRTTSNQYLMGYNVVSDGADGYLHTSYRYYVAQSRGGFLRENYKTIRFISNPDDTDLQQWLLDNTTLIGTVDDQETFDLIYDMGFDVGYNSGYEQGFANSLIGDSLSGPINALSSITLIQIGDTVITLGGVIMTAIALCLVLAFLKLYAGG